MRVRGAVAAAMVCALSACATAPVTTSPTRVDPGPSASPTNGPVLPSGSPSAPSPSSSPSVTYPVVPPPSNPSHVDGRPVVYLTFDDGPAVPGTSDVLAVLDRHDAVGTFMVVGYLAARYPDVLEEILDQGSTIGDHTYSHKYLTTVSDAQVRWQLRATQRVVRAATGRVPTCLRPPYGAVDARVRYLADEEGLAVQLWNNDWTDGSTAYEKKAKPEQAAERILATVHPGSVVLMHDGEEWGPKTARILDLVLAGIEARGWRTAPLCAMK